MGEPLATFRSNVNVVDGLQARLSVSESVRNRGRRCRCRLRAGCSPPPVDIRPADQLPIGVIWRWAGLCGNRSSTHVDDVRTSTYRHRVDIDASARKHGVHDDDMLHAYRHHVIAFATNDETVTMFVGPSRTGEPLEVGVVVDDDGEAIIHAMPARPKFLKGWWTP